MSNLQNLAAQATLADLGACGGREIIGTTIVSPATGNYFFALHFMAASVVAAQTNVTGATNPALSAITSIPAGTKIYGKFSSVTLTSGQAIGYYCKG